MVICVSRPTALGLDLPPGPNLYLTAPAQNLYFTAPVLNLNLTVPDFTLILPALRFIDEVYS